MESGEPLSLMSPGAADESAANQESADTEVPGELEIPPNVSFIGTVNVDETTHPFSPKVLDRANVIEFSDVDVERALGHGTETDKSGLRLKGGELDPAWLCGSRQQCLAPREHAYELGEFTAALEDVHGILAWSNLQFGYRVIDEVSAYVGHAVEKSDGETEEVVRRAFDLQLRQKIVPKLSGGRELESPLARLLHYGFEGQKLRDVNVDDVRSAAAALLEKVDGGDATVVRYPGTARKLSRMLDRLADTGFIGALE
jgi:5-methylcytosine-specific restriction endonuclease McrBC GTP-binding regulatory subunit McrB